MGHQITLSAIKEEEPALNISLALGFFPRTAGYSDPSAFLTHCIDTLNIRQ